MRRTYEYDRSGNSLSAYNVIIMSYTVVDICANPSVGLPSNLIVLVFAWPGPKRAYSVCQNQQPKYSVYMQSSRLVQRQRKNANRHPSYGRRMHYVFDLSVHMLCLSFSFVFCFLSWSCNTYANKDVCTWERWLVYDRSETSVITQR